MAIKINNELIGTDYFNGTNTSINSLNVNGKWHGYISDGGNDANYLGWYGNAIVETFVQSNSNPCIQRITQMSTGKQFIRYCATNSFSYGDSLFEISGISSWSFSNPGYIRFSNGFQIAWAYKNETVSGTAWGSVYYADVNMGNWAVAFLGNPLFVTANVTTRSGWATIDSWSSTSAGTVRVMRPTKFTSSAYGFGALAFGRWK